METSHPISSPEGTAFPTVTCRLLFFSPQNETESEEDDGSGGGNNPRGRASLTGTSINPWPEGEHRAGAPQALGTRRGLKRSETGLGRAVCLPRGQRGATQTNEYLKCHEAARSSPCAGSRSPPPAPPRAEREAAKVPGTHGRAGQWNSAGTHTEYCSALRKQGILTLSQGRWTWGPCAQGSKPVTKGHAPGGPTGLASPGEWGPQGCPCQVEVLPLVSPGSTREALTECPQRQSEVNSCRDLADNRLWKRSGGRAADAQLRLSQNPALGSWSLVREGRGATRGAGGSSASCGQSGLQDRQPGSHSDTQRLETSPG